MARIIIAGDAMVVESAHTLETLKTLEKHRPKALTLYDEDGKTEIFKVGTTTGKGSIGSMGASFGSVSKNGEKKAIITMEIPANTADAQAYAEDVVGTAIINLNKVEAQFEAALAAVDTEKATIRESITVM
ncbi:MAG: hypothetical protein IJN78_07690 [Clostridia bacterium]|nr:hypothetical protein [Clostridia bacterium]